MSSGDTHTLPAQLTERPAPQPLCTGATAQLKAQLRASRASETHLRDLLAQLDTEKGVADSEAKRHSARARALERELGGSRCSLAAHALLFVEAARSDWNLPMLRLFWSRD